MSESLDSDLCFVGILMIILTLISFNSNDCRSHTWIRVSIWLVAGALIYFFYGLKHSSLAGMAYHRISSPL